MIFQYCRELNNNIMTKFRFRVFLTITLIFNLLIVTQCNRDDKSSVKPREKILFDSDWRFSKGDNPEASKVIFDDSEWQIIDLPHDWSILGPFQKTNPAGGSGGYAPGGIGWYRKKFTLPENQKTAERFGLPNLKSSW